jgi:segregation and condensation protein B
MPTRRKGKSNGNELQLGTPETAATGTPSPGAADPEVTSTTPAPETPPFDAVHADSAAASGSVGEDAPAPEGDPDEDPDDEEEARAEPCTLRERVEALLFSAPKPLRSAEIAEFCGVAKDEARSALRKLKAEYRSRATGLEVVKIDGRYQMRVRRGAEDAARLVSPTDISRDLLKTVTVVAFYQPLLQSELVEMIGSKAYDQVRELEERKLVRSAPYAQTKVLGTGPVFAEYFGLRTGKPDEVRKWVAKRLGKEPPAPRSRLTPALARAESALDPTFIEGRQVQSGAEDSASLPQTQPASGGPPVGDRAATDSAPEDGATTVPATPQLSPADRGEAPDQGKDASPPAEG